MAVHLLLIIALIIGSIDCQLLDEGSDSSCECVPHYLCKDDSIVNDGTGIINFRSDNDCGNSTEVCCKLPSDPKELDRSPPFQPSKQCGYRNEQSLETFGSVHANTAEFPWMVALLEKNNEEQKVYACGGTLIHQQVVLTSAHCVSSSPTNMYARVGATDSTNESYQESRINKATIHEKYNSNNHFNNIALLFLDQPFEFTENVGVACLPSNNQDESDSDACLATGWGTHGFGPSEAYETKLKKVKLPVVPHDVCEGSLRKTRLGRRFQLDQSFLCAGGEEEIDTCTGDGGSPLVCPIKGQPNRYKLTGIVSWGIDCGLKDVPGVYVNVPFFKSWIDQQLRDQALQTEYDYIA